MLQNGFQPKADEPPAQIITENKMRRVQDILVVRQHNQIGDMLCSLYLYAALKKKYPGSRITLVAAKTNYEIPFSKINPFLDRVLILDRSSLKKTIGFYKELRKTKYQIGIVPSTIKVSRTSHIINFLSGAKSRVGVKSINGVKNRSSYFLNIKSDFMWEGIHQLERNLDIVKQVGCNLSEEEKNSLMFQFSSDEISEAKIFIKESFPEESKKIIGFHPGAGKEENMWETNHFIGLIKNVYNKFHNYVLLTSGWTDDATINEVETELKNSGIDYKVLHNHPVKKLGAILSLIDLYITNDTGTMHIAGFSDAKIISLFGPTNPKEWAPKGKNQLYIKSKTNNINDITVDDVYLKAQSFLAKINGDKK
jgi:ADP-heptose:LPS heptosyltransferase